MSLDPNSTRDSFWSDTGRCICCGHRDYTNEEGVCEECEASHDRLLTKLEGKTPAEQVAILLNR